MDVFLLLEGHDFYNEAQTMAQVFYPFGKYIRTDAVSPRSVTIKSSLRNSKCSAFVFEDGLFLHSYELEMCSKDKGFSKNCVKICIYKALKEHCAYAPKWGILTGIRPAKLVSGFISDGLSGERILETLSRDYLVDGDKARLALAVAQNSRRIMKAHIPRAQNSAHLYIGIPFCPSRCLYCSFTSYPIDKYEAKADHYLECLKNEINTLPDIPIESVYIGGGTPTSLNAARLKTLFETISRKFDISGIEYTVEAGRPDTITDEKLETMAEHGVNRLSVNPQTMSNETLAHIGRKHSAEDVVYAFEAARSAGFCNINMDLILGLPGETPRDVSETFKKIAALSPDSITAHTLSVKRASRLNEELGSHRLAKRLEIEEMLEISEDGCKQMGMFPYSMYRQKNMLGNFENVGWCSEGKHSVFNIETLEETRTILAAGAGAVTKNVQRDKISRVFNVKSVDEYMKRFGSV